MKEVRDPVIVGSRFVPMGGEIAVWTGRGMAR